MAAVHRPILDSPGKLAIGRGRVGAASANERRRRGPCLLPTCRDCREWADAQPPLPKSVEGHETVTGVVRDLPGEPSPSKGGVSSAFPYINRELSSLEFQHRVLHEAGDERCLLYTSP